MTTRTGEERPVFGKRRAESQQAEAASVKWFASLGDRVQASTPLLALFIVAGLLLIGGVRLLGQRTSEADPTHGCVVVQDGAKVRPPGIVALEFAATADRAASITAGWADCPGQNDGSARDEARHALGLDTWFIVAYVSALAWWCLYTSWASYRPKVRRMALAICATTIAAGVLDLVENAFLRQVIDGNPRPWAALATVATIPKWTAAAVAFPVAIAGVLTAIRDLVVRVVSALDRRPPFPASDGEDPVAVPPGLGEGGLRLYEWRATDPHGQPWPTGKTGICLSGGGIRAASFALGALQGLQRLGADGTEVGNGEGSVYESACYLSTVSGGGYTGTAAQILAHQHPDGPLPFGEKTRDLTAVRSRRRYLWGAPKGTETWTSTKEFLTFVGRFLLGAVFNICLLAGAMFLIATPLGWFGREVVWAGLGPGAPDRGFEWALAVGCFLGLAVAQGALNPFLLDDDPTANLVLSREDGRRQVGLTLLVAGALVVFTFGFNPLAWIVAPALFGGLLSARMPRRPEVSRRRR